MDACAECFFKNAASGDPEGGSEKRKEGSGHTGWCALPDVYPDICIYGCQRKAGVTGFRNMFWTGYVEMFFINLGDFFGLDWFFREIVKKKRLMIPGTEHCEAWNLKKWMLTRAVPKHCIMWPLVVCPLAGLICAGIGALI